MKLPPRGKYYPCFKTDIKKYQAAQRSLSRVVDIIINIGSFEHKFFILKGVLQHKKNLK